MKRQFPMLKHLVVVHMAKGFTPGVSERIVDSYARILKQIKGIVVVRGLYYHTSPFMGRLDICSYVMALPWIRRPPEINAEMRVTRHHEYLGQHIGKVCTCPRNACPLFLLPWNLDTMFPSLVRR